MNNFDQTINNKFTIIRPNSLKLLGLIYYNFKEPDHLLQLICCLSLSSHRHPTATFQKGLVDF